MKVVHLSGKDNAVADALVRVPIDNGVADPSPTEASVEFPTHEREADPWGFDAILPPESRTVAEGSPLSDGSDAATTTTVERPSSAVKTRRSLAKTRREPARSWSSKFEAA